jgi:PAS domain S-box-containing protein
MLIVISPEGLIVTVNPFVCGTLGYEESELIGQPIERVIDISDLTSTAGWLRFLCKRERVINIERIFLRKDNKKIPVLFSSSVIYDLEGKVQCIISVTQDISSRKNVEVQLNKAQKYSQSLIDCSMDMIVAVDKDRNITEFNKAAQEIFGYHIEEVIGKNISMLYANEQGGNLLNKILQEKGQLNGETINKRKNGETFISAISVSVLSDEENNICGSVGVSRDVTEKKRLEMELAVYRVNLEEMVEQRTSELTSANTTISESLKEKEVLLREIHHRVKNNLQIVSSILGKQMQYIKDEEALVMFRDSQNRIDSMALIHEKLYQSTSLSKINISEYLHDLVNSLLGAYDEYSTNISLNIKCDEIQLNIETAIPCGLIINELITNSLKYAFPDDRKGEIIVDFKKDEDNNLLLIVGDNGVGFPNDFDVSSAKSLGLYLVNQLSLKQLDGSLEIDNTNGTLFKISFKELRYKERV